MVNHKHSTKALILLGGLLIIGFAISELDSNDIDEVCNQTNAMLKKIDGTWQCITAENYTKTYGELYHHDDSANLTVNIPSAGTYYKIIGLTTGSNQNINITNSSYNITYDGTYEISLTTSFTGGANNEYEIAAFKDGTELEKCEFHRKVGTGLDVGSAGFSCIEELNTNQNIDIRAVNENAGNDMKILHLNFNIIKITNFDNQSQILTNFLRNDGDTATGNYTFDTNTFHIDSTNNRIGIGTLSIDEELQVQGNDDVYTKMESTGANSDAGILLRNDAQSWYIFNHGGISDGLAINDGVTEMFRIKSDGDIGVGTNSPVGDFDIINTGSDPTQFSVGQTGTGSANVYLDAADGDLSGSDYMSISQDNALDGHIDIGSAGGDLILMESGGLVGLGTTNPGVKFEVVDTGSANPIKVQDSSNTCFFGVDGSTWTSSCSSDEKFKINKEPITNLTKNEISNFVLNYPVYEYDIISDGSHQVGTIAQEIKKIFPEKVENITTWSEEENKTINFLSVKSPSNMDFIVTIQKQQELIKDLQSRVKILEGG